MFETHIFFLQLKLYVWFIVYRVATILVPWETSPYMTLVAQFDVEGIKCGAATKSMGLLHIWWYFICHRMEIGMETEIDAGVRLTVYVIKWASYQIRKIAGCACAGMPGTFFTSTEFKAILAYITARASRTRRCACRDSAVAGKTFPGFLVHAQSLILLIWQEADGNTFRITCNLSRACTGQW